MRNLSSRTLQVIAGLYTAVTGLVSSLLPVFAGGGDYYRSTAFQVLSYLFPPVHLNVFTNFFNVNINDTTSIGVSMGALVFYSLVLIAILLFIIRGFNESRLLAFCFSIVFISACANVIFSIMILLVKNNIYEKVPVYQLLISVLFNMAWAIFIYVLLKKIKKEDELELVTMQDGSETITMFSHTPNHQRLAHYIIDRLLAILIFSGFIFLFSKEGGEPVMDERSIFYIVWLIAITVFLLLFEGIFGFTPAKLLTGSRVTNNWGEKPAFKTIAGRTFARLVPFEPLSFLTDGKWHDEWTETFVLKEKRKGFKANTFFWLIPLILVLILVWYYALSALGESRIKHAQHSKTEARLYSFREQWKNLSASSFIALERKDQYSTDEVILKVQEIRNDQIVFKKILFNYGNKPRTQEDFIRVTTDSSLQQVIIPKNELDSLFTYVDDMGTLRQMDLFYDGGKYVVKDIYNPSSPDIRSLNSAYFYQNNQKPFIDLRFENSGQAARIEQVRSLDDDKQWVGSPNIIPAGIPLSPQHFQLGGEVKEHYSPYKIELILKTEEGVLYKYIISGKGHQYSISRIS